MAKFKVLHPPEIFGVLPSFVGRVAGDPIFVRALVFPGLLDHRQKTCNNRVVGGFLAGKGGICYAFVEVINEIFHFFVRQPVIEEFCGVFDNFFFRREAVLIVEPRITCR